MTVKPPQAAGERSSGDLEPSISSTVLRNASAAE